MGSKMLIVTAGSYAGFLLSGISMLSYTLIVQGLMEEEPVDGREATRMLLWEKFPFSAATANAVFILITFLLSLPGLMAAGRPWLKLSGYGVTFCGLFTLCIGVFLWVQTLQLRRDFAGIYMAQDSTVQEMIQTSFECCGYFNSTSPAFVTDATCPSPAAAALIIGCASAVTSFGNSTIDTIFTALFAMVGADALLVVSIACLIKERKERERYRYIDAKRGYGGI